MTCLTYTSKRASGIGADIPQDIYDMVIKETSEGWNLLSEDDETQVFRSRKWLEDLPI